jgi:RND family efflux transporter MFP subunit
MKVSIKICATLAALFLAGCGRQAPTQAKQDSGPLKVRVAPVTVKQIQRQVESVGTLFPYEEVIISSEIEGPVMEVNADLGDRVTAHQVLVRVSDEEQKYIVAQNEAQLRQSLERLGLKNDKDRVKDVKETPDVRRAQADLFDAEQKYQRTRKLVEQQIASRQDMDQAVAKRDSARAAYDTTINQTRNLIQDVERVRAVLDLQRKKLRDTSIRAPFQAHVKERQVNVGQYVRINTPVFTLVKTDPIRLRIEVPERMSPWIKVGQIAEVLLEAYPGREFNGKIWRISPTVEQSKRTFVVEALIGNPAGELKPGSYAKARIRTDKFDRIHLVPVRSVSYVFGANKAFVVKDGVVEAREVKLGDRVGQDVEIVEGVSEGEQVALTQLNRLDTGAKVAIDTSERVASGPPGAKAGKAE